MTSTRRQFLTRSSAALAALGLSSTALTRAAWGAEDRDRYFVFVYFEGGWDHLLALDPRDPAEFRDADMRETGIQTAYDRLPPQFSRAPIDAGPFALGPAAGDELAALADELSVVRGINMATLTHEVGRRYFITGRAPSGLTARGDAVATLCAAQLGPDTPVPHLGHATESYNVDQPPFAGALQVGAVEHVQYILRDTLGLPTPVPPNVRGALGAYWAKRTPCSTEAGAGASRLADQYRDNRARARQVVSSGLHRAFEFGAAEHAALRARYGLQVGALETPFGRAALAAQALKSGLSRVVSVALSTQLDTHDATWATDHPTRLHDGLTALARLVNDLRESPAPGGGSLWSRTTLVAFSEFGRTARLNERGGRDHLLGNCALIGGAGVRGGRVFGASGAGLSPLLVDLSTGAPSEAGASLQPEHVLSTAMAAAGLDASALRSAPLAPLLMG